MKYFIMLTIVFLSSCTGVPKGIKPIDNFNLDRYLGDWYEIARLDHSFERGLTKVTANYSLNADGSVKVINKGFSTEKNRWKEATGKAYFVQEENMGYLKVSFFGPFYGSYIIFKLDEDYQYAFVTSHNRDFLWLLSRSPAVNDSVKKEFIKTVTDLDFNVDDIIFVEQ
ncbi:lipocalin family protein [Agaribacterium haliotis]|uniref:lipocalin family protein n=1 Tax=Agaribacterium haliotis TaxID=2013869 RepID=UPI000BB54D4C|nr:lipocalin family protein [Agaribacterium haliotis]